MKYHFWRKNVIILSLCTQRCYGRHDLSQKYYHNLYFIYLIARRYFNRRRANTIIDFSEVDMRIYLPKKVILTEAARPR